MNINQYPPEVQAFINELIEENILSDEIADEAFINYLYSQRYDKDYIDCIKNDKKYLYDRLLDI